ncbi:hypothetical protein TNCV_2967561 [Trichonephila clavipes]|nr:hypothetical protein TNCV_2967561 [Trichonephila clavipes]
MSALVLFRLPLVQKETHFAVFLGVLHSKFLGVLLSSVHLHVPIMSYSMSSSFTSISRSLAVVKISSIISGMYIPDHLRVCVRCPNTKIFLERVRYPNMCSLSEHKNLFVKVFVNQSPTCILLAALRSHSSCTSKQKNVPAN